MTDEKHQRAFRNFEDGHRLTYTIREIYGASGEYQSLHHDMATPRTIRDRLPESAVR